MPMPGFWGEAAQPDVGGRPLSGVLDLGPDRVTVSIGETDGTFGWCDSDCREITAVTSLDALEGAVRSFRELGPSSHTTLGGEAARTFESVRRPHRRYAIAMHAGRPVGVMIDPGDWVIAEGVVDQMFRGFEFLDEPAPESPKHVFSALDRRVEVGLPSTWTAVSGDPDSFRRSTRQRMTVRVGSTDGSILTCDKPAGPWELCREVKVRSLDELASAVRPAPIDDHGVPPPAGRSERGTLGGEPSVVVRIPAYEYPAKSGQEVVYVATFHDGRPYLLRIHTTANEVVDLGAVIAGFRFTD
jgi:hypothetical protein